MPCGFLTLRLPWLAAKIEDHGMWLVVQESTPQVFSVSGDKERYVLIQGVGELWIVVAGIAGFQAIPPAIALQHPAHLAQTEIELPFVLYAGMPQPLGRKLIPDLGMVFKHIPALVPDPQGRWPRLPGDGERTARDMPFPLLFPGEGG